MEEQFYFSLNVDSISAEKAQEIINFVIELRGTRSGISVSYTEPI